MKLWQTKFRVKTVMAVQALGIHNYLHMICRRLNEITVAIYWKVKNKVQARLVLCQNFITLSNYYKHSRCHNNSLTQFAIHNTSYKNSPRMHSGLHTLEANMFVLFWVQWSYKPFLSFPRLYTM